MSRHSSHFPRNSQVLHLNSCGWWRDRDEKAKRAACLGCGIILPRLIRCFYPFPERGA